VGTDIRFYVERRTDDGWRRVDDPVVGSDGFLTCVRCLRPGVLIDELFWHEDSGERACSAEHPEQVGYPKRQHWVDYRNHLMFAILGSYNSPDRSLRFFDYDTDDHGVEPVAPARGLPADVGDEVRLANDWDGGHSHSYLTVRELLAYDWDGTTRHVGMAPDVGRDGRPGLAQLTQRMLRERGGPYFAHDIEVHNAPDRDWTGYRQVNWTEPYWRNLPAQFFGALLRMVRLAGADLDSVRCVFWFDN
jgi:hypothetical protein